MQNSERRALDARLFAAEPEPEMELIHLRPEQIDVRHNPRRTTPIAELRRLAETIAQVGLVQPLAVSRNGDGWVLVGGGRRLALGRAGPRRIGACA